jgi:hypothetical protein
MRTKQERTLVAAVDTLNSELSKVLRRALRADLDRTPWPLTPDEEAVLALQALQLAQQLLLHSQGGQQVAESATVLPTPVFDNAREPHQSNGNRRS